MTERVPVPRSTRGALAHIRAGAATLEECLRDRSLRSEPSSPAEREDVERRLARWHDELEAGGAELSGRLALEGLSLEAVPHALGPPDPSWNGPLPPWTETLGSLIEGLTRSEPAEASEPFSDVVLPLVARARGLLHGRIGPRPELLEICSEDAHRSLDHRLTERLTALVVRTLQSELEREKGGGAAGGNLLTMLRAIGDARGDQRYRAFVDRLLEDGLLGLFCRYPVLGKLIATAVDQWVEVTLELLERLVRDLPEIRRAFGGDAKRVEALAPVRSDMHRGGRSVLALVFDQGPTVVYKSRSLEMEAAFNGLLAWCSKSGELSLQLQPLRMLPREGYGWQALVEHRPCADAAALERFYCRAGMLACLLHVLRATDIHDENLIACGEHPTLIDAETLLSPEPAPWTRRTSAANEAASLFSRSVARTNFLPSWMFDSERGILSDGGGLGDVLPLGDSEAQLRWRFINTDFMQLSSILVPKARSQSSPFIGDDGIPLAAHLPSVLDGFFEMGRFLIRRRFELLQCAGGEGPLTPFFGARARFVLRPTEVYVALARRSLEPRFLTNGADRSLSFEPLAGTLVHLKGRPGVAALLRAELDSLEELDVPYFLVSPASTSLAPSGEETIEGYFSVPSRIDVIRALEALDSDELARQAEIIEGAVYAHAAREPSRAIAARSPQARRPEVQDPLPLSNPRCLEAAGAIARRIREEAAFLPDGSATWTGAVFLPRAGRFEWGPIGDDLFDGRLGVALFLAAENPVLNRDLIDAALAPSRRALAKDEPPLRSAGGGAKGLGSWIYALAMISELIEDQALLAGAEAIAARITPEAIAADSALDVIEGTAGLLLALLALHRRTGTSEVSSKVRLAGAHLAGSLREPRPRMPLGFGRGSAGIACALFRAHGSTGDRALLDAAEEAIRRERGAQDPGVAQHGGWCTGLLGLSLARLATLDVFDTPVVREEIERALVERERLGTDRLCCGELGFVELALVASTKLASAPLLERARVAAAGVLERSAERGGYHLLPPIPSRVFLPGLFQGLSGAGYQLLRLADPIRLPSLLLFE